MSLLEEVFKAPKDIGEHVTFKMWPRLRAELWTLVIVAPVVRWNFRTRPCLEVSATDASDKWEAEVTTIVPEVFADELWRHVLRKPVWTKLLKPDLAGLREAGVLEEHLELPGDEQLPHHPLWKAVFCHMKFRPCWRKRIQKKRHINVHELRAVLAGESRRARVCPSSRVLSGADSQVALGCLLKGRSSSPRLNGVLRASLPDYIGLDIFGGYMFVASGDNPSDDPTRDADLRDPQLPVPDFLQSALCGSFHDLDEELAVRGVDYVSLLGLPPLETIRRLWDGASALRRRERRNLWIASKAESRAKLRTAAAAVACSNVGASAPARALLAVRGDLDTPAVPLPRPGNGPDMSETHATAVFKDEKPRWLELATFVDTCKDLETGVQLLLQAFDPDQFVLPRTSSRPLTELLKKPGYLDLFSGTRGVAKEVVKLSGTWCLTFDWSHSASEDLLAPELRGRILELMKRGAFLGAGGGPTCSSFSRAIRPPVRSLQSPLGLPDARETMLKKIEEGNSHADFMAEVVEGALAMEIPAWTENPSGSYLWHTPRWSRLSKDYEPEASLIVDYCRFGTPWRKRTRVFAPGPGSLGGQRVLCAGGHEHVKLTGYSKVHRCQFTKAAEAFPRGLNRLIAWHLVNPHLPPAQRRRLDVAACARCHSQRIGEASRPGPVPGAPASLEEVQLVSARTLAIQDTVLGDFEGFLRRELSGPARKSLCSHAMVYCVLVRSYGNWLFQNGEPLYKFRHLMAFLQKNRFELRPFLSFGWDLITRWERVVPVVHRVPVPEAIVRALLCLGALRGWVRWCCVLGLAYYGLGRAGEPLRAKRRDLLLPSDTLSPLSAGCYMAVKSPKTAFRGGGRTQHLCVKETFFVQFLEASLRNLEPDEALYPGSAGAFRKRWDCLLSQLGVPKSAKLLPGGLRGGSAVREYKAGVDISSLMWRMRIRNIATLEAYVQEVAAISVIPALTKQCRQSVAAASALLEVTFNQLFA